MKKLIVCGAVMLALSSCKSGWSSADKESFLKTCTSGTTASMGEAKAKDYCSCMADKLEKKYPKADDATKQTAAEMEEMAKECVK